MMIYFIALLTFSYTYYNYLNKNFKNDIPISINLSDKYKIYKNNDINNKKNIYKILEKNYFLSWKNNINIINNEFNKNIFLKNIKPTLNKINNREHLCFWVLEHNINKIKNYNIVIFNLKTLYNDENKCITNKDYLENLSKYCHKNKLIFVIISEISPQEFKKIEPLYFNKNNYYSPFNYKNKMFGTIQKLEINTFSNKPANISINRIILDIMNHYGCNKDKIIYIDNQELLNMNNLKISLP
jgi:hypothetical protein